VTDLFTSIEGTALATWARESPSMWAYPTISTLHTVGLAIVVGASTVVNVRLLGFAPAIPVSTLRALFPILWAGFAVNFLSGALLFMADATTKSGQTVFYVKLGCIVLALLIARRIATRLHQQDDLDLRPLALTSLVLWTGAIVAGRLMAYL
jgi:bacteriorhodopsin